MGAPTPMASAGPGRYDPVMDRTDADALLAHLASSRGRRLVAIAGPPGSGKTRLAADLEAALNRDAPGRAATVPMDGFHYDDAVLDALGLRPRKGAPETFDVGGLMALLRRLREGRETVAAPLFDRDLELSRAAARLVPPEVEVVLVEGNYLLLDAAPWDALAPLFDLTVLVAVPEPELRRRLRARWEGYALPAAEIERRVEANDLPNGRLVAERSRAPDLVLHHG